MRVHLSRATAGALMLMIGTCADAPAATINSAFIAAKAARAALAMPRASAEPGAAILRDGLRLRERGQFADAVALFREAAEAGNVAALAAIGDAFASGQGVARDPAEAMAWYLKAAGKGDGYAMNRIGFALDHGVGNGRPDPAAALTWYRGAAEKNDPGGLNNLGFAYENGRAVAKNIAEALHYYSKASELGSAVAMFNLATIYAAGRGVAPDQALAFVWYRRSAEAGYVRAMNAVGQAYENGRGVTPNLATAAVWYRKGAVGGDAVAMANLGYAIANGRGLMQDDGEAVEWFAKAAALGDAQGLYELGQSFRTGRGVAVDPARAAELLNRAAEAGSVEARKALAELAAPPAPAPANAGTQASPVTPASAQAKAPEKAESPARTVYGDEARDFGIAPRASLRTKVAAPTPTSIPGGARVVTTGELRHMLEARAETPFFLIDVLGGDTHATLPGALRLPQAGRGGSFDDATQLAVAAELQRITGGNRDATLVFLCAGPRCWESYNASLRALRAGYRNVLWYRGGLETWAVAGQPVG